MDEIDFKKQYDENEAFANNLFSQIVTEKAPENAKKKADLYGQFAEAAEEGKALEEKTAEKIAEAGTTEKQATEPIELDVSSAVDEPKLSEEKINKANKILLIILAVAIVAFIFALGMFVGRKVVLKQVKPNGAVNFSYEGLTEEETAKVQAAYDFIVENYYDDIDANAILEGAIEGMVEALNDPYGGYLKPENMTEYNDYVEGKDESGERMATVSYELLEQNVYKIKIAQFTDGTAEEFKEAVEAVAEKGAAGIIIDLRDNPGGYATESVNVADIILPSGTIAVAKDRNGKVVDEHKSDKNEISVPVCLLVNGNTASAAELVTGAFRDMEKGEIIGTHTYGKALAQITAQFETDGSGIVLSAYRYYTPSGECIDGKGIEPTIVVENNSETGEDLQLAKALEVILSNV